MMDRRDILKRFGIGTIIAPLIGGAVDQSSAATLIEIPKVRPVELFKKIPEPLDLGKVKAAQLVFTMEDGTVRTVGINSVYASEQFEIFTPDVLNNLSVEVQFLEKRKSSPSFWNSQGRIFGDAELLS